MTWARSGSWGDVFDPQRREPPAFYYSFWVPEAVWFKVNVDRQFYTGSVWERIEQLLMPE